MDAGWCFRAVKCGMRRAALDIGWVLHSIVHLSYMPLYALCCVRTSNSFSLILCLFLRTHNWYYIHYMHTARIMDHIYIHIVIVRVDQWHRGLLFAGCVENLIKQL